MLVHSGILNAEYDHTNRKLTVTTDFLVKKCSLGNPKTLDDTREKNITYSPEVQADDGLDMLDWEQKSTVVFYLADRKGKNMTDRVHFNSVFGIEGASSQCLQLRCLTLLDMQDRCRFAQP